MQPKGLTRAPIFALILGLPGCREAVPLPGLYADIFTPRGKIRARREWERTPLAVASLAGLAEGTIHNAAFLLVYEVEVLEVPS